MSDTMRIAIVHADGDLCEYDVVEVRIRTLDPVRIAADGAYAITITAPQAQVTA
jgi:hypothetical protein